MVLDSLHCSETVHSGTRCDIIIPQLVNHEQTLISKKEEQKVATITAMTVSITGEEWHLRALIDGRICRLPM